MTRAKPSADYVRERLSYDPIIGRLVWNAVPANSPHARMWNTRFAGKSAGTRHEDKYTAYFIVGLDGVSYGAHHLVWVIVTGKWPQTMIDHIDGDGLHNAWDNLREATNGQNRANGRIRKDNSIGLKGVSRRADRGKYRARIHTKGRRMHLGDFDTAEEAHAAYCAAAKHHFGEFARVG